MFDEFFWQYLILRLILIILVDQSFHVLNN